MHILIDLQCCQSDSRFGGIGRYSMSLAKAMVRLPSAHRFSLLLNASLPNENFIRAEFAVLLPQQDIHTFVLPPFIAADNNLPAHTRIAELIREKCIAEIAPDVLHIASLFEGAGENVVTSVGLLFPAGRTVVTLYDLIPFLEQETYLGSPVLAEHYLRKFAQLRTAGALVSISGFSRHEALENTSMPPDRIVNISSAVDSEFAPRRIEEPARTQLRLKCGIDKPFLMFTGSFDARKNHVRLVKAFVRVLPTLAEPVQLVIVGKGSPRQVTRLKAIARYHGLVEGDLVFVGHVTDAELVALYNLARVFVFPSLREGFGLPVLEAMSCGVPTIGSNRTSVPEVIARADALFDPLSVDDMVTKMEHVLTDDIFRDELRRHGLERAKHFSWEISARKAMEAFESLLPPVASGSATDPRLAPGEDETVYASFCVSLVRLTPGPVDEEFLQDASRVVAVNELLGRIAAGTTNFRLRIGWVTPWSASSDVAHYSRKILDAICPSPVLFVNCPDGEEPLDRSPTFWWNRSVATGVATLHAALTHSQVDAVVIQADPGMLDMLSLSDLVSMQRELGREVFVVFHSTDAISRIEPAATIGIRAALKGCAGIVVHTIKDVRNLEQFNIRRNVSFVPAPAQRGQKSQDGFGWDAVAASFIRKIIVALAVGRSQVAK